VPAEKSLEAIFDSPKTEGKTMSGSVIPKVLAAATFALVTFGTGCGFNSEQTFPVRGRLVAQKTELENLKGHLVEAVKVGDPSVTGSGIIGDEGEFQLESLKGGSRYPGLPPGTYQGRLVLVDEGDGTVKKPKVSKKYLHPQSSGWKIEVPSSGNLTLALDK